MYREREGERGEEDRRNVSERVFVSQIHKNHTRYMYLKQITPNFDPVYHRYMSLGAKIHDTNCNFKIHEKTRN